MDQIERKSFKEFRETGLLLFVNQFLHIFGWALIVEVNENNEETDFYPARCKFRGFGEKNTTRAYQRVTKYLAQNIPDLLKDIKT